MAQKSRLPTGYFWRGGIIWIRTDPVTGKAKSTGSRTLEGASAFLGKRERDSRDPLHKAAAKATVGGWAERICQVKSKTRAEGTADMYATKMGHVVRVMGRNTPLIDVDANMVDRYIGTRQGEGVTNNTIQRELTCLMQMLRHARRAGEYHLEMSQVKPIGFDAKYVPRNTYLPADELPILLAGLPPDRAAWVCMAIATGADISDVKRMQPGDYDPIKQIIQMRGTKNRFRSAVIPVPDMMLPLLERALPHLPLEWTNVSAELPAACVRLHVTRVTPKDLRRTASTWLKESGVALDVLGRWMRHGGAKVAFDVYDASGPEATGDAIRQQTQNRNNGSGPLGGMADAGDLKAPSVHAKSSKNQQKPSESQHQRAPGSRGAQSTDLLQRAEARVRRLRAAVGIDESLRPSLAIAESLVEAYHLGAGDPDAAAAIQSRLASVEEASA